MPSSSWNKFNQFIEDAMHKVHNLGSDTISYELCAAASPPVATNAVLANITPIAYTNLTDDGPGSRGITVAASEGSDGSYEFNLTDITITASGGAIAAFRYFVILNNTPTLPLDPLIGWLDYGSDVTIADAESLLIDFAAVTLTIS